jgi:hypothetical protein
MPVFMRATSPTAMGTVAGDQLEALCQLSVPAAVGAQVSVAAGRCGVPKRRIQVARIDRGRDFLNIDIPGWRCLFPDNLLNNPSYRAGSVPWPSYFRVCLRFLGGMGEGVLSLLRLAFRVSANGAL